jgi:hypothetical protein
MLHKRQASVHIHECQALTHVYEHYACCTSVELACTYMSVELQHNTMQALCTLHKRKLACARVLVSDELQHTYKRCVRCMSADLACTCMIVELRHTYKHCVHGTSDELACTVHVRQAPTHVRALRSVHKHRTGVNIHIHECRAPTHVQALHKVHVR